MNLKKLFKKDREQSEFEKMFLERCKNRTPESLKDAILCLLMRGQYSIEDLRELLNYALVQNNHQIVTSIEFDELMHQLKDSGFIEVY